eukprot:3267940-Amphidinium_carterae.1
MENHSTWRSLRLCGWALCGFLTLASFSRFEGSELSAHRLLSSRTRHAHRAHRRRGDNQFEHSHTHSKCTDILLAISVGPFGLSLIHISEPTRPRLI